ncbi:MAG: SAM-dependent methyltransferase [Clostridia bacterium]|nr:SAM-dependent methyltransferase [Clostridia bacterium]
MNGKTSEFAAICASCAEAGSLENVVFHSPASKGDRLKVKGTPKNVSGRLVVQFETFLTEGRVTHDNVSTEKVTDAVLSLLKDFRRADLKAAGGSASLMSSKDGEKVTLIRHGDLNAAADKPTDGNNRTKKHLLTGEERFLFEIGVSDEKGRVRDKMGAKFRQINRFSEYITEAVAKLHEKEKVYVADLCCGKSYLSFAAYHTIKNVLGRDVEMYCVDLKKSVMDYCRDVAAKCGFDGMQFVCGDIFEYTPPHRPDMVISLHACDTATDAVLECAIKYGAEIILSTPCCHHELNEKMDCPTLDFIGRRPLLRQKLCTAATDALRLMRLEAAGYDTDATELIDPEDTPKNVMLRGHLKRTRDDKKSRAALEEYKKTYEFMFGYAPKDLPEIN